jgi:hypothetical protein
MSTLPERRASFPAGNLSALIFVVLGQCRNDAEAIMSAVCIALGGWVIVNAALFAALMLRRDRPEARAKLLGWVLRGKRRAPRSVTVPRGR